MIFSDVAYAMAPPPGTEASPIEAIMGFAPMILILVIFYFLVFRPQQKKQADVRKMIDGLKEGDNVLTTGGMYGTVVKIKDEVLTLQVGEDVRIKVNRNYVAGLKDSEAEKPS